MKIAIVDDDILWCERIRDEIVRCALDNENVVEFFTSGEAYLDSGEQYDISFVDIEMPGTDGLETIKRRQKKDKEGIYIILTRHSEMSRIGYRVNAFRFIDKQQLDEIKEAMDSAKILLERNKKIEVKVIGAGVREITLKDIIFVETEKHYIVVHTKHGTIHCNNKMQEIEKVLPENWFFRCHNAFIINLDEISHTKGRIVYMSNGADADISYRKVKEFKKVYFDRQFDCANA